MKFIMVIIICFGADCRAIYEEFNYESYEACISEAYGVSNYMQQTFPTSSGKVYCWDEDQFELFKEDLKNNGVPTPSDLPSGSISA